MNLGPTDDMAEIERRLAAMPVLDAMVTQRAVRRVLFDPVDERIVVRLIELALEAPTGSNGQNWQFVVVTDRSTKERLGHQYRRSWSLYRALGRRGWRGGRLDGGGAEAPCAEHRTEEDGRWSEPTELRPQHSLGQRFRGDDPQTARILKSVQWQVDNFADIPVLVVCCLGAGSKVPFVPNPPMVYSSHYGSVYPSVQNLLLGARAVGLGGSLITLPLWSQTVARRILGLPMSVEACCIVPLGWAKGRYGPKSRKPVAEVVHFDRYGQRYGDGQAVQ